MTDKLMPCPNPWCESEVAPFTRKGQMTREAPVQVQVECGCGIYGPACDTEAEALAAWNTRPTSARIMGDKDRDVPVKCPCPAPDALNEWAMAMWEELKSLPYGVSTSREGPSIPFDRDQASAFIIARAFAERLAEKDAEIARLREQMRQQVQSGINAEMALILDLRRLREAGDKLSFAAQTTGGTAGCDDMLVDRIDEWNAARGGLDRPSAAMETPDASE